MPKSLENPQLDYNSVNPAETHQAEAKKEALMSRRGFLLGGAAMLALTAAGFTPRVEGKQKERSLKELATELEGSVKKNLEAIKEKIEKEAGNEAYLNKPQAELSSFSNRSDELENKKRNGEPIEIYFVDLQKLENDLALEKHRLGA